MSIELWCQGVLLTATCCLQRIQAGNILLIYKPFALEIAVDPANMFGGLGRDHRQNVELHTVALEQFCRRFHLGKGAATGGIHPVKVVQALVPVQG